MHTIVPLRQRGAWTVLPALAAAVALGVPVAALSLAVMFGAGVQPMPRWTWLFALIAVAALLPIPAVAHRWLVLRRRARLHLGDATITISHAQGLRSPLVLARDAVRAVVIDDQGKQRFRVHTESGPYGSGDDDAFLWSRGWSALPSLTPDTPPNVLLLFDPPVAGADPRPRGLHGIYRGERMAGLLLAAADAHHAARVLDELGVTRPITMPDLFTLEQHLNAPEGGRFALGRREIARWGWALAAFGVIVPLCAAIAGVLGLIMVAGGKRLHGAALALVGFGVFGVRMALWLG